MKFNFIAQIKVSSMMELIAVMKTLHSLEYISLKNELINYEENEIYITVHYDRYLKAYNIINISCEKRDEYATYAPFDFFSMIGKRSFYLSVTLYEAKLVTRLNYEKHCIGLHHNVCIVCRTITIAKKLLKYLVQFGYKDCTFSFIDNEDFCHSLSIGKNRSITNGICFLQYSLFKQDVFFAEEILYLN